MRKSQSLSINVVIIAALALLVLVVLSLIFTGKIKIFGSGVADCGMKGGSCETACESNEAPMLNTNCAKLCCIDFQDNPTDNPD